MGLETSGDHAFGARVTQEIDRARMYGSPGVGAPGSDLRAAARNLHDLLTSGAFDSATNKVPASVRTNVLDTLAHIAALAWRFATDGSTSYPGFTPIAASDNPEAPMAGAEPTYDHVSADFNFEAVANGKSWARPGSTKPLIAEVPPAFAGQFTGAALDAIEQADASIAAKAEVARRMTGGCPEGYVRDSNEPELCMRKDQAEPITGWAAIIREPATSREGPSHYICPTIWPERYEAVKAYGDKKIVAFIPLKTFVGDK